MSGKGMPTGPDILAREGRGGGGGVRAEFQPPHIKPVAPEKPKNMPQTRGNMIARYIWEDLVST